MDAILKANIFFFITAVAVVVVAVLIAAVLVLVLQILSDIRRITSLAREESERISRTLEFFRSGAQEKGEKVFALLDKLGVKRKKGTHRRSVAQGRKAKRTKKEE
ncbi:hypothetical protein D6779_03365 [Candidatus Parcubacteria bacterium]|nr:MAG: hypothetical protein D6779_03365 [Candidatus Parcubacteria bacterium]